MPQLDELVRKHRAPNGALRRANKARVVAPAWPCQKAPSAKRCIKTEPRYHYQENAPGQKAPSAKRCIKTPPLTASKASISSVRKHRAPKGALRPGRGGDCSRQASFVRKHRAPENFACNSLNSNFNERRIPRHLNDAASSREGVEAELHATFSNNPPR